MVYVKGILSGLAAILIAEVVFAWPLFSGSKATGIAALVGLSVESVLSPKFWLIAMLLFGLFLVDSRAGTILRVLFFWIPTVLVSAIGLAFLALWVFVIFSIPRHQ